MLCTWSFTRWAPELRVLSEGSASDVSSPRLLISADLIGSAAIIAPAHGVTGAYLAMFKKERQKQKKTNLQTDKGVQFSSPTAASGVEYADEERCNPVQPRWAPPLIRPRPATSHAGGGEDIGRCRGMEADTPVVYKYFLCEGSFFFNTLVTLRQTHLEVIMLMVGKKKGLKKVKTLS